jgi:carbon-monoxide dehydrogenase medium subunit
LTDENLRAAAAAAKGEVDPISDIRGSADYKRDMAEVWVRRTLERALGRR